MAAEKTYLSAEAYLHDTWRLAANIRRGDWKPDWLIGLWRGGSPVAIAVHEFLKVSGWQVKHLPLKSASYTGIGENVGEVVFTLGQETFGMFRSGEKVLFVDDVFDTGKTAKAVHDHMRERGIEMRLACVYWKPGKNLTDVRPDYFAKDIGNEWIVFPHEIEGLTQAEIREKDRLLAELL